MKFKRESVFAAAVTFVAALAILILLFVLTVGDDRSALSQSSIPELQDDEEVYLEPELFEPALPGDPEAADENHGETEPLPSGLPDEGEESKSVAVPSENPAPDGSNKQPLVGADKPSDVKSNPNTLSKEEQERLAKAKEKTWKSPANGDTGATDGNGTVIPTGTLSGKGNAGRTMTFCNNDKISFTGKVTIKVNVTVNAEGRVTQADAVSGGSDKQRAECVKRAKNSRWTPLPGATPAKGTITFTIK